VDRDEITRAQRRRQAREALEFERDREQSLEEQVEETVAEIEGARIDEEAFARMAPDDAAVVREAMHLDQTPEPDGEWFELDDLPEVDAATIRRENEEEVARLQEEIAGSHRRQQALERYIEALDGGSGPPGDRDPAETA
jgi:hypothetical protein